MRNVTSDVKAPAPAYAGARISISLTALLQSSERARLSNRAHSGAIVMRLSLRTLVASTAIAAACQTTRPISQTPVTADSATDATERVVAHVDSLTVSRIDLGERRPGSNTFRAQVVNGASSIRMLGVDLRVTPGLWVLGATQRQQLVVLAPGESRALEMQYVVGRLTPEDACACASGRATARATRG
jgi:hypothetical protein